MVLWLVVVLVMGFISLNYSMCCLLFGGLIFIGVGGNKLSKC